MGWTSFAERQKTGPRPDTRLGALAGHQHGVVSTRQLTAIGFTSSAVRTRVRAGRLHRVHRGVYAVGHPGLSFQGRCMAAVISLGADAVLSHRAAAALWGLHVPPQAPLDVTTACRSRQGPAGVTVHRVRHPPESTRLESIALTTVPQTLLDLAATISPEELDRTLREVHATRAATREELAAFVDTAAARPGVPALRRALGREPGTRSPLERRFLTLCRNADLQPPLVNAVVAGLEVDFLWPTHALVVETDGFATHATRHGFERDRRRDAILARAGLRVLRFSARQIAERRAEVLGALQAAGVRTPSRKPSRPRSGKGSSRNSPQGHRTARHLPRR